MWSRAVMGRRCRHRASAEADALGVSASNLADSFGSLGRLVEHLDRLQFPFAGGFDDDPCLQRCC